MQPPHRSTCPSNSANRARARSTSGFRCEGALLSGMALAGRVLAGE